MTTVIGVKYRDNGQYGVAIFADKLATYRELSKSGDISLQQDVGIRKIHVFPDGKYVVAGSGICKLRGLVIEHFPDIAAELLGQSRQALSLEQLPEIGWEDAKCLGLRMLYSTILERYGHNYHVLFASNSNGYTTLWHLDNHGSMENVYRSLGVIGSGRHLAIPAVRQILTPFAEETGNGRKIYSCSTEKVIQAGIEGLLAAHHHPRTGGLDFAVMMGDIVLEYDTFFDEAVKEEHRKEMVRIKQKFK